ncbi:hypothetical protein BLA29_013505 [Euroglyphus maynei]|uniref:Uncharacterized protein n=1 Tax=Euroglyphus maynei TaxID=6958 RepID=A0A1Y3AWW5_EURMA|nr:hypothetical protein BLA29_013505 [Euroglyphus maynei]
MIMNQKEKEEELMEIQMIIRIQCIWQC